MLLNTSVRQEVYARSKSINSEWNFCFGYILVVNVLALVRQNHREVSRRAPSGIVLSHADAENYISSSNELPAQIIFCVFFSELHMFLWYFRTQEGFCGPLTG